MYKHADNRRTSRCSRCRRRAERKGFGGLRIGITALTALMAGIFAGSALSQDKETVCSVVTIPTSPPVTETEIRTEPVPPVTTSAPKTLPGDIFVPKFTAAPAEPEPTDEPLPTILLDSPEITVSIKGEKTVMLLEDYLVGVVAAEMPASSRPAALEAQAVAARTFTALRITGKSKCKSGCDVCDDVHCCQAYAELSELQAAWGRNYESNIEKIAGAVRSTEGRVVTYNGKLISALYHASSGPYTENSEEVFAVALPYLVSVESHEGKAEMIAVQEFPLDQTVEKLNSLYPDAEMRLPLDPTDFDVWGRTDAGRVQLIRLGGTVVTGAALRKALGLKSTRFEVSIKGDKIVFTCVGYGHGVGMSQTGANEMAKDGADCEEILTHFYTGTEIALIVYSGG